MPSDSQVKEAIEALSRQFAENYDNGDFSAIAGMFAEDAVLLPPGARLVSGRGDIRAFFRQARRMQSLRFEPSGFKPLGDGAAREVGVVLMGMRGPRQQVVREVLAKYVMLWQLDHSEWQLESFIWNRSAGRRPGARGGQARRVGGGPGNRPNRVGAGGQGDGQNRGAGQIHGGGQNRAGQ